ncbi:MAG: Ppx/GppA phosphatase family protein [Polyangiaceae bacterium]
MRVATIDIGTNTVLLLVAEKRGADLVAVREGATITRLGENVDKTRELKPEAITRTSQALDDFAVVVNDARVDRVAVVGTSAMRDARGGEKIREHVKASFGVDARVLSGDEEAKMTFAGALSGLAIENDESVAVFDIGGGSTEIVRGKNGVISYAHSFDVGSVRLTERHVKSDPPSHSEIAAVEKNVRDELTAARGERTTRVVGIAGTMTTLCAVSLEMHEYDGARVHGHVMTRDAIAETTSKLAKMPLSARKSVPGLEPKRADVIVAGGIIALACLDVLGGNEVTISDRGVRWGLALELVG